MKEDQQDHEQVSIHSKMLSMLISFRSLGIAFGVLAGVLAAQYLWPVMSPRPLHAAKEEPSQSHSAICFERVRYDVGTIWNDEERSLRICFSVDEAGTKQLPRIISDCSCSDAHFELNAGERAIEGTPLDRGGRGELVINVRPRRGARETLSTIRFDPPCRQGNITVVFNSRDRFQIPDIGLEELSAVDGSREVSIPVSRMDGDELVIGRLAIAPTNEASEMIARATDAVSYIGRESATLGPFRALLMEGDNQICLGIKFIASGISINAPTLYCMEILLETSDQRILAIPICQRIVPGLYCQPSGGVALGRAKAGAAAAILSVHNGSKGDTFTIASVVSVKGLCAAHIDSRLPIILKPKESVNIYVTVSAVGQSGAISDELVISTSSQAQPVLRVPVTAMIESKP